MNDKDKGKSLPGFVRLYPELNNYEHLPNREDISKLMKDLCDLTSDPDTDFSGRQLLVVHNLVACVYGVDNTHQLETHSDWEKFKSLPFEEPSPGFTCPKCGSKIDSRIMDVSDSKHLGGDIWHMHFCWVCNLQWVPNYIKEFHKRPIEEQQRIRTLKKLYAEMTSFNDYLMENSPVQRELLNPNPILLELGRLGESRGDW